jgi:4-amino-4-deoxy-L-arabinose transferase-like glycosyltransferase
MKLSPPPVLPCRTQSFIAAIFLLLVLVPRIPTFFRSVLDWDESLYFLMAAAWRQGHLPYTTIWDNKPIGIYAIFAIFEAIFGERVAAIRAATVVFVTLSAFTVFKVTFLIVRPTGRAGVFCGLFAGLMFILGAFGNDGLSANTELFMATCTLLGVLAALSGERFAGWPVLQAGLTGLALGAAFMVKYVAIFEAPAVLFLLTASGSPRDMPRMLAASVTGAALPLMFAIILYGHADQFSLWWENSIASNFRRLAPPIPAGAVSAAMHLQLARWGSLYGLAVLLLGSAALALTRSLRSRQLTRGQLHHLFLAAWLLGGGLGVAVSKSFYDHYFLQLLPALCVTAGWVMSRALPYMTTWPRYRLGLILLLLAVQPALTAGAALRDAAAPVMTFQNGRFAVKPDPSAVIGADIKAALASRMRNSPGPAVYVFDGQPIIYALTKQAPPTRYVLPSVLSKNFLGHVANIDAAVEVRRILSENPIFIVRDWHPPHNPKTVNQTVYIEMDQALAARYSLWLSYGGMDVYRLNSFIIRR